MIADKACYERGCACYDSREGDGIEVIEKKPWVGLTDYERQACTQSPFTAENYRAIEAKLKEKNT